MRKHMTIQRHDGTVSRYTMPGHTPCDRLECAECGKAEDIHDADDLYSAIERHRHNPAQ